MSGDDTDVALGHATGFVGLPLAMHTALQPREGSPDRRSWAGHHRHHSAPVDRIAATNNFFFKKFGMPQRGIAEPPLCQAELRHPASCGVA